MEFFNFLAFLIRRPVGKQGTLLTGCGLSLVPGAGPRGRAPVLLPSSSASVKGLLSHVQCCQAGEQPGSGRWVISPGESFLGSASR